MKLRLFDHSKDMTQLNSWLEKRGLPVYINFQLPRIGFIVEEVAVGFLCQTDSLACIIDPYITNVEANSETRSHAISKITEQILFTAKTLGFKRILYLTFEDSLAERSKSYGFITSKTNFGYKEL